MLHRRILAEDEVYLWCYVARDDEDLLLDVHCGSWIRDYAFANAKFMLGEARSKFATIAGPQGGGSLNGTAMKSEAQTQMDALITDLKNYVDGSQPITWVIG